MGEASGDYYELLGIERDAGPATIRRAFRQLASRYHPDRNPQEEASEHFRRLAEAYSTLSDEHKRRAYDALHPSERPLGGSAGPAAGSQPRGRDLHVPLVVPLERIDEGGQEVVRFVRRRPCEQCGGQGGQQACRPCAGGGLVARRERMIIDVPAGAPEGMALLYPGRGNYERGTDGRAGHLRVTVHAERDARFTREGADLGYVANLNVSDAALGVRLLVPTLRGRVVVPVSPGTQPGHTVRVPGWGLTRPNGTERGDLLVRCHVRVPEQLSPEERAIYRQLRELESRRS
jgi:molecular chaperone DnaJ